MGHTPFCHIGERTLGKILDNGIESRDGRVCDIQEDFRHNFQSLRVLDTQKSRCKDYMGINLTFATREGILKHTKCIKKESGKPYQYGDGLNLTDMEMDKTSITLEGADCSDCR